MNAASFALRLAAEAEPTFDPNDVTPGVAGFLLTIVIMGIVVLLVFDMVRRVRRVNYRSEIRERLEAEAAAEAGAETEVDAGEVPMTGDETSIPDEATATDAAAEADRDR